LFVGCDTLVSWFSFTAAQKGQFHSFTDVCAMSELQNLCTFWKQEVSD